MGLPQNSVQDLSPISTHILESEKMTQYHISSNSQLQREHFKSIRLNKLTANI